MNRNPKMNDDKNPMVHQELKFLRAEVERLKRPQAPVVSEEKAEVKKVVVERRDPPATFATLRTLLVAAENFFGPEAGKTAVTPSEELKAAMAAAAKLVRQEKKP